MNKPDTAPDDVLDKILVKAFNDFYDYITEHDIIKAAHEYSEKTVYKDAKSAIRTAIQSAKPIELADDDTSDWRHGFIAGYHAGIDAYDANLKSKGML